MKSVLICLDKPLFEVISSGKRHAVIKGNGYSCIHNDYIQIVLPTLTE